MFNMGFQFYVFLRWALSLVSPALFVGIHKYVCLLSGHTDKVHFILLIWSKQIISQPIRRFQKCFHSFTLSFSQFQPTEVHKTILFILR